LYVKTAWNYFQPPFRNQRGGAIQANEILNVFATKHPERASNKKQEETMLVIKIIRGAIIICSCIIGMISLHCDNGILYEDDGEDYSDYLDAKDSVAVRSILDANGLPNKPVRDVVEISFGMVWSITIDSFPFTRFVLPKALDSCSYNIEIIIRNSPVETLSVVDSIRQSLVLSLHYTKLQSIPDCISLLRGPLVLNLWSNEITSISPQVLNCYVLAANFRSNNLCSIPDSIKTWVAKKCGDDKWQLTQNCDTVQ
jgi:hypothetical protein